MTAVLATVESREEPIKDAAVRISGEQIGSDESFCFRLHKRGAHGLEHDTLKIEQEIGGVIWTAVEPALNSYRGMGDSVRRILCPYVSIKIRDPLELH